MTIIKRLAAVLAAVLLISLLSVSVGASAADDRLRYGKEMLRQIGRNNANALIYVYDVLAAECADAKSSEISIKNDQHKINQSELETVYQVFRNDYPEYFWLPTEYQCQFDSNDAYVEKIMFKYIIRKSISEDKKAVESKANAYIKQVQGKVDFDKSHILHDLLIENITYEKTTTSNNQDIYSAFVNGKAVCAGYAKAYEYLLHKVGIPAFSVTGKSKNPVSDNLESHEWTMALLDGHWYCTDVTWDDQGGDLYHAYLNITVEQLIDDHPEIYFKDYLPKTDSKDDNFFTKNKHMFSTLDINLVINDLKTQNGHSEIYYDGKLANMPTICNSLANELRAKLASVDRNFCTCSFTILGKEIHIQVKTHTENGSECKCFSATGSVGNATTANSANNSGNAKPNNSKQTTAKATAKPNNNKNNKASNAAATTGTTAPDSSAETPTSQDETVITQAEVITDTSATQLADGVGGAGPNNNAIVIVVCVVGGTAVATGASAGIVYFIKKKKTII